MLAGLAVVGAWRQGVLRTVAERVANVAWGPARRMRYHYSYLNLDPEGVEQYVKDFEQYLSPLSPLDEWPPLVYTRFLMSTDFFQNGADEKRRIQYLGFYLPTVTTCYNPLARFDD